MLSIWLTLRNNFLIFTVVIDKSVVIFYPAVCELAHTSTHLRAGILVFAGGGYMRKRAVIAIAFAIEKRVTIAIAIGMALLVALAFWRVGTTVTAKDVAPVGAESSTTQNQFQPLW
jgi:hypothetical protein